MSTQSRSVYVYSHLQQAQRRADALKLPIPRSCQDGFHTLEVFIGGQTVRFGNRHIRPYLESGDTAERTRWRNFAQTDCARLRCYEYLTSPLHKGYWDWHILY